MQVFVKTDSLVDRCVLKFLVNVLHISHVTKFRELGIGIVPYSPLGRGFFGGKAVSGSLPLNSFLVIMFGFFSFNDIKPMKLRF